MLNLIVRFFDKSTNTFEYISMMKESVSEVYIGVLTS